jgi:hypothetical protein
MQLVWRRIWQVAAICALTFLVSGLASGTHGATTENPAAAKAVAALRTGNVPVLPADFTAVMGYRPHRAGGPDGRTVLVKRGNGCSSPFGATSFDFSVACGEHDLGYDLLRYATAAGQPLGQWARKAIDARFHDDVHARCDLQGSRVRRVVCDGAAQVYSDATAFNSWRQRYGNPGNEHLGRTLPVILVASVAVAGLAALRRRSTTVPCPA